MEFLINYSDELIVFFIMMHILLLLKKTKPKGMKYLQNINIILYIVWKKNLFSWNELFSSWMILMIWTDAKSNLIRLVATMGSCLSSIIKREEWEHGQLLKIFTRCIRITISLQYVYFKNYHTFKRQHLYLIFLSASKSSCFCPIFASHELSNPGNILRL